MSLQAIVIVSAMAGGAAWAAITLSATWWFNRQSRRLKEREASRWRALGWWP